MYFFFTGGHSSFFGLLNTFVHIWMYLYYFLAALGPAIQPYLWWKKYLTTLQMAQFVIVMIHELQLLFIECNYPKAFVWWIGLHACLFFFLFRDFYNNTYINKAAKNSKDFDVNALEVDPHREGIKQSDLWAKNYEHLTQKARQNGNNKMATGYISDEGLRNRAFIDNNRSVQEWKPKTIWIYTFVSNRKYLFLTPLSCFFQANILLRWTTTVTRKVFAWDYSWYLSRSCVY